MEWSPQQLIALKRVDEWLKSGGEEPFYLAGYAGTGKTTLAKHFAEGVSGRVLFAAYTGKAALVMQQRGCPGARTIHSLIYLPQNKSFSGYERIQEDIEYLRSLESPTTEDEKRLHQLERELEKKNEELKQPTFHLNFDSELQEAALLIVDECSMIDRGMGEDLLSFGIPILVLGDPAQLPPVRGTGYFTSREPDYLLTEIHRQEADNPIIHLATLARNGEKIKAGKYGESRVLAKRYWNFGDYSEYNQLICGKNATRRYFNHVMRERLGFDEQHPQIDDKIICLRNSPNFGLLNGSMWKVSSCTPGPFVHVMHIRSEGNGAPISVRALAAYFLGTEKELQYWQEIEGQKFDFGYVITCHKAQGSQWENVVVMDESSVFRNARQKWLYTAITRASKKLDLVEM